MSKIPLPQHLKKARLLSFNGGLATWGEVNEEGDLMVETVQDCYDILEQNKRMYNETDYKRKGIKADWAHFATFPNVIIEKWIADYGINVLNKNHWPAALKKLEDPEWRYLKTMSGKIW